METTMNNTATGQEVLFDSWREFVDYADTAPSDIEVRESRKPGREERNGNPLTPYWSGVSKTWAESIQLAKSGWMEGSHAIESQFLELMLPVEETKMETVFSVVGPGTLALGRYIDGHPKPWLARRRTPITTAAESNRGVLRLAVNISQSCQVSADSRFQVGAAILALVETLERNHRRVELMLCSGTTQMSGATGHIRLGVIVKRADAPFNLATLAYAFANSATLRRLGFSVMETLPWSVRKPCDVIPNGGYGKPDTEWTPNGYHCIPGLGGVNLTDKESVGIWIRWAIARLEGE